MLYRVDGRDLLEHRGDGRDRVLPMDRPPDERSGDGGPPASGGIVMSERSLRSGRSDEGRFVTE